MLSCEEALERMSQALDGPLPLEAQQELEAHLDQCPACRASYEVLFQMEHALQDLGETPAPAELSSNVMAQIRAETVKPRRSAPRWSRAKWQNWAGLAACVALCIGVYLGTGLENAGQTVSADPGESAPSSQTSPAPQTRDLPDLSEDLPAQADESPAPERPVSQPEEDQSVSSAPYSLPPAAAQETTPKEDTAPPESTPRTTPAETEAPAVAAHEDAPAEGSSPSTEPDPVPPDETDAAQTEHSAEPTDPAESADPAEENGDLDVTASAVPPWGTETALIVQTLPAEAEKLLPPQEDWTQEEDGTRWCLVTAEELEVLQTALSEADETLAFPEKPWEDPCAVVILPEEAAPSASEGPSN